MIWYEIYEPDDNDYGTWTGKIGLNPDRGQVGVICVVQVTLAGSPSEGSCWEILVSVT
jgi:hypothetical protein